MGSFSSELNLSHVSLCHSTRVCAHIYHTHGASEFCRISPSPQRAPSVLSRGTSVAPALAFDPFRLHVVVARRRAESLDTMPSALEVSVAFGVAVVAIGVAVVARNSRPLLLQCLSCLPSAFSRPRMHVAETLPSLRPYRHHHHHLLRCL